MFYNSIKAFYNFSDNFVAKWKNYKTSFDFTEFIE